jgi:hypothetical protein
VDAALLAADQGNASSRDRGVDLAQFLSGILPPLYLDAIEYGSDSVLVDGLACAGQIGRTMQRARLPASLYGVVLFAASCFVGIPAAFASDEREPVTLTAAHAAATVDPGTGRVTSILLNGVEEMATPHSAGSETPYGYLEVVDVRDHRTYNPLTAESKISDWKRTGHGDTQELSFCQQYNDAPFRISHTLRQTPAGLRWQASLRLLPDQDQNRSLVVSWVLPLPSGWKIWGPNNLDAHTTDGVTPYRYVYAHTDPGPAATILPLAGVWGKKGAAAVFSPPDVRKCQIIFEVQTQGLIDAATGVRRRVEDLQSLRVAHHMIGLRPGKDLTLAVCIAGTRPDWRSVLGHYVMTYPELFEPIPQTRQWEGMYGVTTPGAWTQGDRMKRRTRALLTSAHATCVELHGHFLEYGHFIEQDLIDHPDKEFTCRPHPSGPLSCAGNRGVMDEMLKAGIGPFVYFYNVHSLPDTIDKRYPGEMLLDEQGKPLLQWYTEPAVVAQPGSAFGRNLMDQLRLLIKAYPQAPGFFVDNYSIQKVGFNHDDGVTMVHNQPCYDLNRNHQDIGTRCFDIAHQAGKIMMVNKLATIESARGADMVLLEGVDPTIMAIHAFACVNRPFFPLGWKDADQKHAVERGLQQLLIWGGTPGAEYAANDPDCMEAYRPLTDTMIGKRWVFDADPLALPAGYQGQIFRIDPHAPQAGDVVVTIVDQTKSWKDAKPVEGLKVTVRLPEAEQLSKITFLAVEHSAAEPIICHFTREGQAIEVELPPVGAAGVLRLSRQAPLPG